MRAIRTTKLPAKIVLGLLFLIVFLTTLGVLFPSVTGRMTLGLFCLSGREATIGSGCFLGLVEGGHFRVLSPSSAAGGPLRLTGIAMQEARSPESGELALAEYEGCVIVARGHDGGGWIYSARVVYRAGPFLTAVLRRMLRG